MITRVQVKNFRSIASADVSLGPLTVLVGRNGAGKSAFVDVLRFVRDAVMHNLDYAFSKQQGIGSLRRWSPNRPYDMEIHVTAELIEGVRAKYGFTVGSNGGDNKFRVKREYFRVLDSHPLFTGINYEVRNGKWEEPINRLGENSSNRPILPSELILPALVVIRYGFSDFVSAIRGKTYSIFPNTLRLPQTISNERVLNEDGSNLASILRAIEKNRRFFPDLRSALGRIVDGVKDLRVRQSGGFLFTELQHADLNNSEEKKSPWLGLGQESDGTLRAIAMLTALYQNDFVFAPVVTLEEPEISLHPGALAVLADVIHEVSSRQQVIITTQSPDLISRFNADELRVVERVNGATQIGPLDSVQRQVVVDNLFSAGDLLRIEGLRREPDEAVIK